MSSFVHRGHAVEVEYSSLDDVMVLTITNGQSRGIGDASSVDELLEFVDDMIDTMTEPDPQSSSDHEQAALDAEDVLDDDQAADIRKRVNEIADDYEDRNRTYMQHRGYRAEVSYDHDHKLLIASVEDVGQLSARSLKRLYHHFLIMIDEHLACEAKKLM